jgi:hypothetical protein
MVADDTSVYLPTRAYRLPDRVLNAPGGPLQVADLLKVSVDPDSWVEVGGPGEASAVPGGLLVYQNSIAHRQIRVLLEALRCLEQKGCPQVQLLDETAGNRLIEDALSETMHESLWADRTPPFLETVHTLTSEGGIADRTWIDWDALNELRAAQVRSESWPAGPTTLREALERTIPDGMAIVVQGGALTIVGQQRADQQTDTRVYRWPAPEPAIALDWPTVLRRHVRPESWLDLSDEGPPYEGVGEVLPVPGGSVILHYVKTHREIERFLALFASTDPRAQERAREIVAEEFARTRQEAAAE